MPEKAAAAAAAAAAELILDMGRPEGKTPKNQPKSSRLGKDDAYCKSGPVAKMQQNRAALRKGSRSEERQ